MKKSICVIMAVCLIMSMVACAPQKEIDEKLPDIPGQTDSEATKPTESVSLQNTTETEPEETGSTPTESATEPESINSEDEDEAETEPTEEAATEPAAEPAAPTEAPTEPPTEEPTVPPTEHRHSYITTVVAPTCVDGGFTVDHCECGEKNVYDNVPALGHTFGEWTTAIAPTTTANGQRMRTCSACNYQEFESIEKLSPCETHAWAVTEKETVDAYPLRHYGYVTTACSVCGEKKGTEARYFTPDYIDYATEIGTIISLVNAMRASEGLSQLTTNGEWDSWAATRAQEISVYYAHSRPNGASWGRNDGVDMAFGENIAKNADSGADFYYNFLNSPQHCGLMKEPDATGIAVSIYVNEYGDSYCAMVIYGPMGM